MHVRPAVRFCFVEIELWTRPLVLFLSSCGPALSPSTSPLYYPLRRVFCFSCLWMIWSPELEYNGFELGAPLTANDSRIRGFIVSRHLAFYQRYGGGAFYKVHDDSSRVHAWKRPAICGACEDITAVCSLQMTMEQAGKLTAILFSSWGSLKSHFCEGKQKLRSRSNTRRGYELNRIDIINQVNLTMLLRADQGQKLEELNKL